MKWNSCTCAHELPRDTPFLQELPADLIVLSTSDEANLCHVETANLDGVRTTFPVDSASCCSALYAVSKKEKAFFSS